MALLKREVRLLASLFLLVHGFVHAFVSPPGHGTTTVLLRASSPLSSTEEGEQWLDHGLLLSSFSDGLLPNRPAIDFLMRGLVKGLWKERLRQAETDVAESAIQSPCCGPDSEALLKMESADKVLGGLAEGSYDWREALESLKKIDNVSEDKPLELRFLYIPTALYALRKDSANSPGKQRQRARADGKKRRTQIAQLLSSELGVSTQVLTATLDLDDGSIKQPEGSDDSSKFPVVRRCLRGYMWKVLAVKAHTLLSFYRMAEHPWKIGPRI